MQKFEDLWIWDDPAVAAVLEWYRAVAVNRAPAKFRIAAAIPVEISIDSATEDVLWAELDRLTPKFVASWRRIRTGKTRLGPRTRSSNLLDLCRELTQRMLAHCNFCQWNCKVDRSQGSKFGTCKLADGTRVSTYFHHMGEELIYRGRFGSGTIFFTSCNMRCAFCQNGDISTDKDNGTEIDARALAAMAWVLRTEGCHNINWVGGDPTIHLHTIVEAIALLGGENAKPSRRDLQAALPMKADHFLGGNLAAERGGYMGGFNAPMLWNSNFFMTEEAMKILRLLIDVWLPDFKFGPGRCAINLARTPRYWETVTRNLKLIDDWGEDVTIRHLVMPNHVECCTEPVLDWVADNTPRIPVNIMDQYHPDTFTNPRNPAYDDRYADVARHPNRGEIEAAFRYAKARGIHFETVTYERNKMGLHP